MKITAILCNYNGEDYLHECIKSVLDQERPVDEFIIVDDGSTDRSREIISEYSSLPTVRYIPHEVNQGQAAGFNTAIAAATGEFLCFIDSDDIWFPNKVGEIKQLALDNPQAVLLQHNLSIINGVTQTDELFRCCMSSGDFWQEWNKHIFFPYFTPTAGLCIRSEVARKALPVPVHLKHSADSFLTRAVIAHGQVATAPQSLGGYRRHDGNAVHGNTGHSSWRFFLDEVAPHLDQYYLNLGLPSPIRKLKVRKLMSFSDKLLDVSLRRLYNAVFRK